VDRRVAGTLHFGSGHQAVAAQFLCAFDGVSDNGFTIVGERGHIRIPQHFHRGTRAVLQVVGAEAVVVDAPFLINGFEGQIVEALRCIRAGLVESPALQHAHSLAVLGWMDHLRRQLGVHDPFE